MAPLIVSVPELGYVDTLVYTVMPGTATSVRVTPADTAVYTGASFTLRARVLDWAGNERDDPATLTVASGPVSLNAASGGITATAIGRAAIIARSANHADTGFVSIVPQAWLATQEFDPGNGGPRGIFLMQLDGSGKQGIAAGLDNSFLSQGFGWSPDGQQLALVRGRYINLLRPGGTEQPIVEMTGGIVTATRFSRDGQWVYFAHGGSSSQPAGLYRVRLDGSGLQHLGENGIHYFAAPSHDGQSVAYVSDGGRISVLDVATNRNRMYGGQSYLAAGTHVAWSPTEDLIAYDSGTNLVLVRSDGTQSRTLGEGVTRVKWMDFSPDGRWLLVSVPGLMLFDVQTGLKLPLGQFTSYGPAAWRP
jgi:Tol biopolymer transport system component